MNLATAQLESERLETIIAAREMLLEMSRVCLGAEALLVEDRDEEADAAVRECWQGAQRLRAIFLTWPPGDEVWAVLERIEFAQEQALEWLAIIKNKVPGWSARRREMEKNPCIGDNP